MSNSVLSRATFMWYHTDVNGRILENAGRAVRTDSRFQIGSGDAKVPPSLQNLCAGKIVSSKLNFFAAPTSIMPETIKNGLAELCERVRSFVYIVRHKNIG
jgi:hypothetical protein